MISSTMKIEIEKSKSSRLASTDFEHLEFGAVYSDHMFTVDFKDEEWKNPLILPFQNLSMSPATAALHYGQTIFEGLKAFRGNNNEILVFRPQAHCRRMNKSAERLCMPQISEELFMEGLHQLISIDHQWVPDMEGCSLYIRPMLYASDEFIRVKPSSNYKFIIFTSPVAKYYSGTVKVIVENKYVRAADGGIGFAKAGGNYAASLLPAKLAAEKGYQQILWTDAKEHKYIEESGTMNAMFLINDTLVTPALSSSILSGVTRDSIITIAKEWGVKVEERKISIDEIIEAHNNGSLKDAFGTGTAATITHISAISYNGNEIALPEISTRTLSTKIAQELSDIRLGKTEDRFNWVYKIQL
ncbi:MAG: branched-chain amino acid aminotransferase [Cytophagales bacterium]|nr:MAG: branched-chain amino acid aminotransferase [Cytophagales bacterium]